MSGNNDFAPYLKKSTYFVVLNVSPQQKCIKIFNYPILLGTTRDLLQIPGVGEADIRASLLKGELQHKILSGDITIVQSNIDLLQFDSQQYQFLTNAGITFGTQVTPSQSSGFPSPSGVNYTWRFNIIPVGSKNGVNRTFFTPDYFIDGTYSGNTFHIMLFHNGRQLVQGTDFSISKTGIGNGFNTLTFIAFAPISTSQIYAHYAVQT